ncbi:MAG: sigma-70 family RNA polymerase sigma factor [Acidobacteriota bacterium]|nr:sigma-70 family RNA polymerase sigma factor [Acidobacteriota bacterium]
MATSADSDPPLKAQLELPFVLPEAGEPEIGVLFNDRAVRDWIAQLWGQHQVLLMELAHYELRDWDRAQEVVQDTWVDFLKSLHRFEGRCSAKTWLVQILKRCIRKERRHAIFSRAREAMLGAFERGSGDYYSPRVGSQGNWHENPEQRLLAHERLEHILRAGRRLPQRQAEIWILRDLFEWTSKEVSASLGITIENQRVLLHRARRRLQAEMHRYLGETASPKPGRIQSHDLQRP